LCTHIKREKACFRIENGDIGVPFSVFNDNDSMATYMLLRWLSCKHSIYADATSIPSQLSQKSALEKQANLKEDLFLRERARILFTKIRCLTCANQTIDSSEAEIAQQLRREVYDLLRVNPRLPEQELFQNLISKHGSTVVYDAPKTMKNKASLLADWSPTLLMGAIAVFYGLHRLSRWIGPTTPNQAMRIILGERYYSTFEDFPFTVKERLILYDLIKIPKKYFRVPFVESFMKRFFKHKNNVSPAFCNQFRDKSINDA
jgi:cytochrome c-type biogenesis protein CcmH/NrfF